jgi:hypothetical protein
MLENLAQGGEKVETAGANESDARHLAHAIAFCFAVSLQRSF